MHVLKIVGLSTFLSVLALSNEATASGQDNKVPPLNEEEKEPSAAHKVGRETAKVVEQVEEAGHNLTHGFKKQRHKDNRKQKEKNK